MVATLPDRASDLMHWTWPEIEPHYRELIARPIGAADVDAYLADWTALADRLHEAHARLHVATTTNTADEEADRRYRSFLDEVYPRVEEAEQQLREKLLKSGLTPSGFEEPLRKMRAEADLFRTENLPLLTEEQKLSTEYNRIIGSQTVEWDGQEVPLARLLPIGEERDRQRRERAWRLAAERRLQDRDAINDLWTRFLDVRLQLARNAGKPDYRAYRWQELLRLDYTPEDTRRFESAIEEIVVPAVARRLERRRRMLGLDSLRPWDLQVDPMGRSPLRPFGDVAELRRKTSTVFHQVDPGLGDYFDVMDREGYLDLDNRMDKAPGGYCTDFPLAQRPFIFMNAVGMHADVQTLVHESGHAFHNFESVHLPYTQQRSVGLEFAEVASMSMELLAAPYLSPPSDGFYGEEDAARARVQHLERMLTLWLTVGSVDAFQHWVYEHPDEAADPDHSDAVWMEIRQRFFPVVDYSGLERELETSWHGILHIHVVPFYIVEYGVAQLGAVQVWANARRDQAAAVAQYRRALSLGGTRSLPQLFAAAGARLAFDAESLREAVQHIEETLEALE